MPVMQYPTSLTKSIGRYRHLIGFSREQKRLITDNLVTRCTLRFRPDIPGSCVPDNHGQGFRGVIASATTDILAGARFHWERARELGHVLAEVILLHCTVHTASISVSHTTPYVMLERYVCFKFPPVLMTRIFFSKEGCLA